MKKRRSAKYKSEGSVRQFENYCFLQNYENYKVQMAAVTMATMTMNMKKMGNQVVGKWVQSSWQMGLLASLNVRLLPHCKTAKLQSCTMCTMQNCKTAKLHCTQCETALQNCKAAQCASLQNCKVALCTMWNCTAKLQSCIVHNVKLHCKSAKLHCAQCETAL